MPELAGVITSIDARPAETGGKATVKAFSRVRQASRQTRDELGRFSKKTQTLGKNLTGLGSQFRSLFAGISTLLILRKTITVISGFEETLATVRGVTKATDEQFQALSRTARELGATTRFSAQQAGEGLLFLARAGFEADEAIEALPATLNLATAGAIDLGTAADIASNILSQFGLVAKETSRIVDTLTNTSNSSNTNILQLSEAMKFAGPIAGVLGRSVEETAAAIGVLGDAGIQGSLAGTGMRQMMLGLLAPTAKAKVAIEGLGLKMEDLNPQMRSLTEIFITLRKAELGAEDALAIFGRRTAGVALILTGGTEKLEGLTQANIEAEGAAAEMARLMDDTLSGALRNLKSAFEEVLLSIGDAGFGGALRALVETITGTLRVLVGMEDTIDKNITLVKSLASAVWGLVAALGTLMAIKIVKWLKAMAIAAAGAKASTIALSKAIGTVFVVVAGYSIGEALFEDFKWVQEIMTGAITNAQLWGESWIAIFIYAFNRVSIYFEQLWEEWKVIATAAMNKIVEVVVGALSILLTELSGYVGFVRDAFEEITGKPSPFLHELTQDTLLAGKEMEILANKFRDTATAKDELDRIASKFAVSIEFNENELFDKLDEVEERIKQLNRDLEEQRRFAFAGEAPGPSAKAQEHLKQMTELAKSFSAELDPVLKKLKSLDELSGINELREKDADLGIRGGLDTGIGNVRQEIQDIQELIKTLESGKIPADQVAESIKGISNAIKGLGPQMVKLSEELKKIADTERTVKRFGDQVGAAFTASFGDVILGAKSAEAALADFGRALLDMILQMLVLQPIAAGISNALVGLTGGGGLLGGAIGGLLMSANGNVFSNGNVVPFANGGVLTSPTIFPMANGGIGIAAEAGKPEAIMPLERGPGGKLGVSASGGGTTTVNVHVHGVTDADSFRRSSGQIQAAMRSSLNKAGAQ